MPVTAPEPTRPARRALPSNSSDAELVAQAQAGDAAAYEAIFRRYQQPLLSYCRHMLGGRDEAEDALQQAFIRAHRALTAGHPPRELRPWLYAIARNCCLTAVSARRPTATLDGDEPALDGLSDEVGRREELRELVSDLGRLPEEQRSALLLAELEDLTHVEIAEIVGCPVTKVKALVYQARVALLADRSARDASCRDIREELALARGGALRRGPLRRHLRMCAGCREFQLAVGDQRRSLAIVLPVVGSAGLAAKVLAPVSAIHAGLAGGAVIGGPAAGTSLGAGATASLTGTTGTAALTGATATTGAAGTVAAATGTGPTLAGAAAASASTVATAASTSTLATAGAAASTSTLATAGAAASASTLATAGTAAATAATGGAAVTTGSVVGGGILAKLAIGGAVATLASAGALAVHQRHHRAARMAAPARLASVKVHKRAPGGWPASAATGKTAIRHRRRRSSAGAGAAVPRLVEHAAAVSRRRELARPPGSIGASGPPTRRVKLLGQGPGSARGGGGAPSPRGAKLGPGARSRRTTGPAAPTQRIVPAGAAPRPRHRAPRQAAGRRRRPGPAATTNRKRSAATGTRPSGPGTSGVGNTAGTRLTGRPAVRPKPGAGRRRRPNPPAGGGLRPTRRRARVPA